MVDAKALLLKLTGAVRELARHSTPAPHIMRALDEIDAELTALPNAGGEGQPPAASDAGDPDGPEAPPPNASEGTAE